MSASFAGRHDDVKRLQIEMRTPCEMEMGMFLNVDEFFRGGSLPA